MYRLIQVLLTSTFLKSLMHANSLVWLLTSKFLKSLMHAAQTHWCSTSPQHSSRAWCMQTHWCTTHFKVLEEFDARSADSLVWYFTVTFLKSLMHADSLVYYSLQRSWRVSCTDSFVCYSPQHSWRAWCAQTRWCPPWSWDHCEAQGPQLL